LSDERQGRPAPARLLLVLYGALALAALALLPFRALPASALWLEGAFVVLAGASAAVLLVEEEKVADGARLVALLFFGSFLLLLLAVLLGEPFGSLRYTANLGPRLGGLIPIGVPFLWTVLVGGALAASRALQGRSRPGWGEALRLSVSTATFVALLSFSLDPVAGSLRLWSWGVPGQYHGVPFLSFLGWWSTSLVLAVGAFTLMPGLRLLRGSAPPGPIGVLLLLQIVVLGVALRNRQSVAVLGGGAALVLLVVALLRAGADSSRGSGSPAKGQERDHIPERSEESVEDPAESDREEPRP
jgi:uncharacterized membrane protein